jgi:predicted PurR-regulated permease PerM
MIKRILAGLAGVLTLVSAAVFTLGSVLVAPLGVLGARAIARRRGRVLTRGAAWLGAVVASFVGVALVMAAIFASMPPDVMKQVRAAADSAQAKQQPPEIPKWLERVNPAARQQAAVNNQLMKNNAFVVIGGIVGSLMACSMLGTIAGSIGWLASMLFAYAFSGRWIRAGDGAPPPIPMDE